MTIKTAQLKSQALLSASYDDEAQTLDVTFASGSTYTHPGVPPEVFQGLVDAPSPGRYWHANIKGVYG